jgi:hypothetical protein
MIRFANCESILIRAPYEYDLMFSPRIDAVGCSDLLGLGIILIAETGLPLSTFCIEYGSDSGSCRVKTSQVHLEQVRGAAFKKAFSSIKKLSLMLSVKDSPCDWTGHLISDAACLQKLDWKV